MKGGIEKFYPEGWSSQTGPYHGAGIAPPPDYAALGPLVGGVGEKVTEPGQVGPAMARAVAAVRNGQPAVLDIHIGPSNERGLPPATVTLPARGRSDPVASLPP